MNSKIILITFALTACSTSTFDTSIKNEPPIVENRKNKNSINSKSDSSMAVTNNYAEDNTIVNKPKIISKPNPNSLFENYSVYFDLDEYTVKENFIPLIIQHAEFLSKNPNEILFVEGHTDERGGIEYNLALGQRRANAVRVLLLFYGAKENQVEAYSYGSEKPKAMGSNEEAWRQNRRVDLYYKN